MGEGGYNQKKVSGIDWNNDLKSSKNVRIPSFPEINGGLPVEEYSRGVTEKTQVGRGLLDP